MQATDSAVLDLSGQIGMSQCAQLKKEKPNCVEFLKCGEKVRKCYPLVSEKHLCGGSNWVVYLCVDHSIHTRVSQCYPSQDIGNNRRLCLRS